MLDKGVSECVSPDKHLEAGLLLKAKCTLREMTSRGCELKLDIKKNEKGYALLESLIALALLSIVSLSLITILPMLLEEKAYLDQEQAIYHQLFELHHSGGSEIDAFRRGYKWCTTHTRRDGATREICL